MIVDNTVGIPIKEHLLLVAELHNDIMRYEKALNFNLLGMSIQVHRSP